MKKIVELIEFMRRKHEQKVARKKQWERIVAEWRRNFFEQYGIHSGVR